MKSIVSTVLVLIVLASGVWKKPMAKLTMHFASRVAKKMERTGGTMSLGKLNRALSSLPKNRRQ